MRFEGNIREIMIVYLVRNDVSKINMVFTQCFDVYLSNTQVLWPLENYCSTLNEQFKDGNLPK